MVSENNEPSRSLLVFKGHFKKTETKLTKLLLFFVPTCRLQKCQPQTQNLDNNKKTSSFMTQFFDFALQTFAETIYFIRNHPTSVSFIFISKIITHDQITNTAN